MINIYKCINLNTNLLYRYAWAYIRLSHVISDNWSNWRPGHSERGLSNYQKCVSPYFKSDIRLPSVFCPLSVCTTFVCPWFQNYIINFVPRVNMKVSLNELQIRHLDKLWLLRKANISLCVVAYFLLFTIFYLCNIQEQKLPTKRNSHYNLRGSTIF